MSEGGGFFSRWSQRKAQVREGQHPVATPPGPPEPVPAPAPRPSSESPPGADAPSLPTLADVAALAPGAEVSRFMQAGVTPEVKNAAMRKLFADPHFNVMDGLDTYIDDYGQPDPIPASMLRQLVQGEALGLFAEERAAEQAATQTPPDPAPDLDSAAPPPTALDNPPHEDADLRLQQDLAAGPAGAESGPGA